MRSSNAQNLDLSLRRSPGKKNRIITKIKVGEEKTANFKIIKHWPPENNNAQERRVQALAIRLIGGCDRSALVPLLSYPKSGNGWTEGMVLGGLLQNNTHSCYLVCSTGGHLTNSLTRRHRSRTCYF
jgi:hypothetical protein